MYGQLYGVQYSGIMDLTTTTLSITKSLQYTIGRDYTREAKTSLPTDDTDLATHYTAQEYADVDSSNDVRVNILASGKYAVHQYKIKDTGLGTGTLSYIRASIELQSDRAPSASPVYLQIWNETSGAWETIATNSSAAANTDFTMAGQVSYSTDYINGEGFVTIRVYQHY